MVDGRAHAYGGPRFMARVAEHADVAPLEPLDDWLPSLPWPLTRREIRLVPLSEAQSMVGRWFVKTPREKDFEAGVYTGAELPRVRGADPLVLVSDVVSFSREYRLLVLDGEVCTGSRYLTAGRVDARPLAEDPNRDAVLEFAQRALDEVAGSLPSAVTLDVGWLVHPNGDGGDDGPAIVEANMAWFSNIYECDPARALDVVLRSAGPREDVQQRDRPFLRIGVPTS